MSHPYSGEYHEDLQMEGGKVKHTAGPWAIDYHDTIGHIKSIAPHERGATPTVARYDLPEFIIPLDEQKANAYLIASAPELLEACKRALPWMGKLIASRVHEDCVMPNDAVRTMEMLEAYIAKAEGRA